MAIHAVSASKVSDQNVPDKVLLAPLGVIGLTMTSGVGLDVATVTEVTVRSVPPGNVSV